MKLALFTELTKEHLVVLRSTLKLRKESWYTVSSPEQADIIICDVRSNAWRNTDTSTVPYQIIVGDAEATELGDRLHLPLPLRALKLIKMLDAFVVQASEKPKRQKKSKPRPAAAPTDGVNGSAGVTSATPGAIPWAKKNIQFKGKTNFSSLPVTAELAMWLEIMASQPVSYNSMKAALPMDAELIDTVLNSAAKGGVLIDEHGNMIPPIETKSLLDKFFKR